MFNDLRPYEKLIPVEPPEKLDDLDSKLQIYADSQIEIWYAPLGKASVNPKVWILGITPGWNQMRIAYESAAEAIRDGSSPRKAAASRKPKVAFAGSMRENLILMLDNLGLAEHFDLESSRQLFGGQLLRTGSVLKYPVFKNEKNYAGHSPGPTKHPVLREMLDVLLADDLQKVRDCVVVPLGKAVESALEYSVSEGRLEPERVLWGFPHPSGANGHRLSQFRSNQRNLSQRLGDWFDAVA